MRCLVAAVSSSLVTPAITDFQISSTPFVMSFWHRAGCGGAYSHNATVGQRVFSKREIFGISNEPELCYSYSGAPGDPKSMKWACSGDGSYVTQTPYASEDCSGQALRQARGWQGAAKHLASQMWAVVLSGRKCLSVGGPTGYSFIVNASVPESERPYCTQSSRTMEEEIVDLVSQNEADEKRLQRGKARLAQSVARNEHEREVFFIAGTFVGFIAGALTITALYKLGGRNRNWMRPPEAGARELSCSMLATGNGDTSEGGFAELPGLPGEEPPK
ncbi:unnamed protein product [Prorocentrum cordatum]|uniref:Transmembrane protein n=1 Tax=Prorocentrum cordatum TaxID=2364126 RepID=A0ABN9UC63_9DINO|nr:unnamed protein product [Polarella glacialis]